MIVDFWIKKSLVILLLSIMFVSCNNNKNNYNIKGSWYCISYNEYQEMHIDDSLFVYISPNADVLIPFEYEFHEDTIFIKEGNDIIVERYKMINNDTIFGKRSVYFINNDDTLLYIKMDTTISNLNEIFISYETLDSFSQGFYKRGDKLFNSTKSNNIIGNWYYVNNEKIYSEVYIDSVYFIFSNENIGRDFYKRTYKRSGDTLTFYNKNKIEEKALIDYADSDFLRLISIHNGDLLLFNKLNDTKLASDIFESKISEEEYFLAMKERSRNYNNNSHEVSQSIH